MKQFDWPPHHAVAHMPGSLPMGGVVPMTPVHAFAHTPEALKWRLQTDLQPQRHDLDLDGLLGFVIDQVVTDEEAVAIVQATEVMGYRDEAPGIATPPGMHGDPLVHSFSHRINMYRYDDNDVFNLHTDGSWPGYSLSEDRQQMLQWDDGFHSGLTMLLYLNGPADGVQGGNTRLFKADGTWVDVSPVKGSALFFRHGFGPDSVRHIGCRVQGSVSKYVARINVMFKR